MKPHTIAIQQGPGAATITVGQQTNVNKYELLRDLARIAHANINIKGGNYFQDEIFKAIRDSEKHVSVTQEHPVPLRNPKKKRKHHHVDILVVDEDRVTAINSKGKSFNNTKSEDSELSEYNGTLMRSRKSILVKRCATSSSRMSIALLMHV